MLVFLKRCLSFSSAFFFVYKSQCKVYFTHINFFCSETPIYKMNLTMKYDRCEIRFFLLAFNQAKQNAVQILDSKS